MNASTKKYARSLHAQLSLGTTSDDRFMPPGYVAAFATMPELVLTEKLDGQNNCLNRHGVFARSHTAPSNHPWDRPLWERWKLIRSELRNLEIFGENMYGIHSIAYTKLTSYFYVFAVRDGQRWLSWEEVQFYAALLDLPIVPELTITDPLRDFIGTTADENAALDRWLTATLGMSWQDSVATAGQLGGYDPATGQPCSEGFVVRNRAGFATNTGRLAVAPNEFSDLFKLVRAAHIKTDVHWTKTWKPATLIDYTHYKWYGYEYLSKS